MKGFMNLFTLAVCLSPIIATETAPAGNVAIEGVEAAKPAVYPEQALDTPDINIPSGANFNELIKAYNNLVHRLHRLLNTMNYEWRDLGISPIREYRMQQSQRDPPLSSIVTDIPLLGAANPANFNNDDWLEIFRSLSPVRTRNGFRFPGIGEIILEQPNLIPAHMEAFRQNLINGMPARVMDIPELGPLNPRTLLFTGPRTQSHDITGGENAPAGAH